MTGQTPEEHGIYNEWMWDPATMTVRRPDSTELNPFWAGLAASGMRVGILDVPFAPLVGLSQGFEIVEWGAHDRMTGRLQFGPAEVGATIDAHPRHPYRGHAPRSEDPADLAAVTELAMTAVRGIEMRGALARDLVRTHRPQFVCVVFTEIHDAGHHLWHTVEPGAALYALAALQPERVHPSLADVYAAADREIELLVDEMGPDASVLVLSFSGMRAGLGWPRLMTPLLERIGMLPPGEPRRDAASLLAAAKRAMPPWLRRLYHRHAPPTAQIRLARSTMVPSHDWSRTRAFEAMHDHYGYCRLNVAGRERDGIVPLEDYDSTRSSIADAADSFAPTTGAPSWPT
jgi:predicted AlkP superfamily phosphohydrolase/phosphomutase